jgi:hypothetical protein
VKYWRCSYQSALGTIDVVNTFHVKADPTGIADDRGAEDVAADVDSWLTALYRALTPTLITLQTLTVREELAPGSTDIPAEFVHALSGAGTFSTAEDLPYELCLHVKAQTSAAIRSGHGGMFMPPVMHFPALSGNGRSWNPLGAYWVAVGAFFDALLDGHDWTTDLDLSGHLSYVIYSHTRRLRAEPNYAFDVTGYTRNPRPTWLRSRGS